ncbi:MAG: UDP-N-acetylenolpyruvoylglucosamine reductase, partial [Actinobacteria bacterium]|nr:UDP-N-acetylenolpyruvoylglucosamine reductase [Actinomycetota bacterium]
TQATFHLVADSVELIRERMNEMRDRRRANQPLGMASAGSVFKNPPGAHAGYLIDRCGLSGRRVGGAVVSEKHANFIVNRGDATASDIRQLMGLVSGEVRSRSGIQLELEVKLVGFESG